MLTSFYKKGVVEAGCDEAGRGCLAGPVVAAAVVLPKNYKNNILNDSKKISEKIRNQLRCQIEKEAIAFGLGFVYEREIEQINILKASIKAMHIALNNLNCTIEHIIIDGNTFYKYNTIPHKTIIKGDGKYASIAAASILAKTYRDEYMIKLHEKIPYYGWNKNKGYATAQHRALLKSKGACIHHRKNFTLFPKKQGLLF